MENLVELKHITMTFPGVIALDDVSFDLRPGEVHVLLGENGAGKSTLVKTLSGINKPTKGEIVVGGRSFSSLSPKDSISNKIAIIYQELSVINELSIAENLFVGKLPSKEFLKIKTVDYKTINNKARELMKEIGLNREPNALVKDISISEKQLVEITKALAADAKIIIMDEPTSSLSIEETDALFAIIRKLKEKGIGIIYISHKLKEIKQIGDRVTVLKDGKYVSTLNVADIEVEDMIPLMVGRELKEKYLTQVHHLDRTKKVIFSVKNLTRKDKSVRNISFDLHEGEILGFAGLIGAGRSELMEGIFGVKPISSGEVILNGKKLKIRNTFDALKHGIAFVTENRRETGFFQNFEIWREISVTVNLKKSKGGGMFGLTNDKAEKQIAEEQIKLLNTKCYGVDQMTVNLSGGNQQKVIVSKWLAVNSEVFIFDEPTKGIDVGAKSEMYTIMRDMANNGKGVMMVSSEMPELLATCDRIIVFRDGEISAILNNDEATEEKILFSAVPID
ncbi:MAG: ATP-binding cassette domain-containing protein [Christensenellaceae bacterium]